MSEETETAYKYTVPLNKTGRVDKPEYDMSASGEALLTIFTLEELIVVDTEATPHYHKEDVNVEFEEVDAADYRDSE